MLYLWCGKYRRNPSKKFYAGRSVGLGSMSYAVCIQYIAIILAGYFVGWFWWSNVTAQTGWHIPKRDEYLRSIAELPDACPAADLALSESKDYFKNFRDSARNFDLRATGIMGFVGGGTGIWAAAGGNDILRTTSDAPLLYASIAFLLSAMMFSILALMFRSRGSPDVQEVLNIETLKKDNAKSVLAAALAWQFIDSTRQLQSITQRKRAYVNVAQVVFIVGILFLVIGTIVQPQPPRARRAVSLPCTFGKINGHCTVKIRETR